MHIRFNPIKKMMLSFAVLAALGGVALPAAAASYYVVSPTPRSTDRSPPALDIQVALNSVSLPNAMVGVPYDGFDFNHALSVVGDPAFESAGVSWGSDTLPPGLALTEQGELTGTPTQKNPGASFTITASYLGESGQQVYEVVVNGVAFKATQIATGQNHTCAVTTSGGAKCWGLGTIGQLGDGLTTTSTTPVDVVGLTSGVATIAVGHYHTCAVTIAGGATCWGNNYYGPLGNGTTTGSAVPVNVSGLTSGVASVSGGKAHTCAVTTSGGVKCWGDNFYGQLGNGTTIISSVPVNVSGLTSGVASISVGQSHTCAVTTAGGAKCWGSYANGILGDGKMGNGTTITHSSTPVNVSGLTSGVASLSAGSSHTCAVTTSGGAKCWGANVYGNLGDGTITTGRATSEDVAGLTSGVASISAGVLHTCAVTTSGGVKCWGYNSYGQLGDDSTTHRSTPVNVSGLTSGVASLSAGENYTCAVTASGAAKCWGRNNYGRLGDGTITQRSSPVVVQP